MHADPRLKKFGNNFCMKSKSIKMTTHPVADAGFDANLKYPHGAYKLISDKN